MAVTGLLAALAANQLTSPILPQHVLSRPNTSSPHSAEPIAPSRVGLMW